MYPFSLLIKPAGPDCNLACTYCFYTCRESLFTGGPCRMSDEVLEALIRDYLRLGFANGDFAWQGGEPTLMGLEFYRRVVELQKRYGVDGQTVHNALQTNAVLLDDRWCAFLHENRFLVGISLDGPRRYHDAYRLDHAGGGSHQRVCAAIDACRRHNVQFNVLVLLNALNVEAPDELFDFFRERDIRYLQFIPCVERREGSDRPEAYSITPRQYGDFLCRLFDRWLEYGPGQISIRLFDSILTGLLDGPHTLCTFGPRCDQYVVIEHTGEVFACDFFVEPEWRLGHLLETPLGELAHGQLKRRFARRKRQVPNRCLTCRYHTLCRGGCPRDRLAAGADHRSLNYLCAGYRQFFDHALGPLRELAAQLRVRHRQVPPRRGN